ncbi:hypothetical protein WG70_20305 [Burkholderia oklahomensis EO147]|nr:hypothetical protein WG70_20305 [Burkholderia oklahomensis EO147]AOI45575.1 hypothetical protein WI23_07070 [Burkholderia oklahomensis C6786]KUY50693.1 hypothetical protein WG70_17515 [Burkholderia oklahomensis EO147]KUY59263.1 hypothetical protein WI23_01110 [Burkholderia oklahomensis C6786]
MLPRASTVAVRAMRASYRCVAHFVAELSVYATSPDDSASRSIRIDSHRFASGKTRLVVGLSIRTPYRHAGCVIDIR